MTSKKHDPNVMSTKRLHWALGLGAVVMSSAAAAVAYMARRVLHDALPRIDGNQTVSGLRRSVEIMRDRWSVPHIYAQTEEDLFFAQGYVQAQDRLFQMDAQRRVGYGRLGEIAGPLALTSDRMARICGWHQAARAQWRGIQRDPETKTMMEAFAAGVNAFIAKGQLPAEYRLLLCSPEPWRPLDGCAWGAVLAWGLSVNWQTELLRLRLLEVLGPQKAADLTPGYGPAYQTVFPHTTSSDILSRDLLAAFDHAAANLPLRSGAGLGSNNWVVNGRWTHTGRPMLANDPHLPPVFPTFWYENHLIGGRYNVSGFTSPGVPGVIIGHNEHLAWGITNAYPDIQDLYLERFHDTNPLLYEANGGWERATQVDEVIRIRGRRRPHVEHVRHTRHGPVISDLLTPQQRRQSPWALSLRWTAHEENNHPRAMLDMCRATHWEEFYKALRHWGFPPQNVVYADTRGNIGYMMPGRVPRRKSGKGLVPVPGWHDDYAWQGWIAHEALPALFNPESGTIVTANNRITGEDEAPFLTGEWLPPYRARRISALIETLAPLSVEDHARIQADTVSIPVRQFVRLALDALEQKDRRSLSEDAQRAIRRLTRWDGDMRADDVAPSLAFGWMVCFVRTAIFQAVGESLGRELLDEHGLDEFPMHPFHEIAYELGLRWLADGAPSWIGEVRVLLPDALEQTLALLRAHCGSRETAWQWGKIHYVELHNYLSRIPAVGRLWKPLTHPLGGDGFSVNQARVAPHFPPGAAHVIASCRMIVDVGDWDNSVSTLPGGQSGHPASDHYQDSVDDWLQGKYHPMLYSRAQIEAATQNRLVLHPGV